MLLREKLNTGFSKGFTLIEILIALSIVAILIALPVVAYSNFSRQARDTQRKNDLNKLQGALEQYRANEGRYPEQANWLQTLVSGGYLSEIVKDSYEGREAGDTGLFYGYEYLLSEDGQSYSLRTLLEGGENRAEDELVYYTVNPEGPKILKITPGGGGPVTNTPPPRPTQLPTVTVGGPSRTPTPSRSPTPTQ
ncbi:MAG: prepilin-type N-terminal cleavage/methylation domain-containing protein [Patescibacteria group bacterium]|nr:prepilin-type N-terminal cleavage/methylation domain-containing protein [Patescibacteria group bacterium]